MSDVIRRRADGSWGQGDVVPTYASDHAETWSGTADKSMDRVSDEYAKYVAAQKERNLKDDLEEEAHQLGLSSWESVDKWLKELESQNQKKG
ncbi:MAG: hypothetical protein WCY59_03800 [Anaerovoracaceae bacterium]